MNQRFGPGAGGTGGAAVDDKGLDRRDLLRSAGGLALTGLTAGLTTGLAGCVSSEPEAEAIDPRSLVYPAPPEEPRFYYDRTIWGSNDVKELTSTDRFRQFATGQSERGTGFAKPFGVAADNGRIFVSDTVSRYVHVFDYPRGRYYNVGRQGVGRLAKPLGVAVDGAGRLYVVDGTASRVLIYDLEGNYITTIGDDQDLTRPTAVAVTLDGDRIYVLDTGGVGSQNHRVVVYDPQGKVRQTIGTRGSTEGKFNLPLDCTLDGAGNLYVLDTGNFRCQVFAPDGSLLRAFGGAGRYPGQFGHPKGIAVDSEGIIYIADTNFGLVQIFNNEGQVLMALGRRNEAQRPGEFILPAGIAVDVDRRIYVVDQYFRKLEVFRPAAVPETTPMGQPIDVRLLA